MDGTPHHGPATAAAAAAAAAASTTTTTTRQPIDAILILSVLAVRINLGCVERISALPENLDLIGVDGTKVFPALSGRIQSKHGNRAAVLAVVTVANVEATIKGGQISKDPSILGGLLRKSRDFFPAIQELKPSGPPFVVLYRYRGCRTLVLLPFFVVWLEWQQIRRSILPLPEVVSLCSFPPWTSTSLCLERLPCASRVAYLPCEVLQEAIRVPNLPKQRKGRAPI